MDEIARILRFEEFCVAKYEFFVNGKGSQEAVNAAWNAYNALCEGTATYEAAKRGKSVEQVEAEQVAEFEREQAEKREKEYRRQDAVTAEIKALTGYRVEVRDASNHPVYIGEVFPTITEAEKYATWMGRPWKIVSVFPANRGRN